MRLLDLEKTRQRNFRILDLYSNFLNLEPDFIKKELIDELVRDCGVTTLEAYTAVLAAAFDIDSDARREDRIFEREYLIPTVLTPKSTKTALIFKKSAFRP